jgi:hypothetical protein
LRPLLLAVVVALCAACQASGSASFQPEGECVADGRAAGLYPDLEARLPATLSDLRPSKVDSGRSCSGERLSTLKGHGVTDLRYAGATWDLGKGQSVVAAVFTTPPTEPRLDASWMDEFYESGAQASTKTENIQVTHPTYGGAGAVYRLDTLNELSFQSVVVWPGPDLVHVVIVATQLQPGGLTRADHDAEVGLAVLAASEGT